MDVGGSVRRYRPRSLGIDLEGPTLLVRDGVNSSVLERDVNLGLSMGAAAARALLLSTPIYCLESAWISSVSKYRMS